MWRSRVFAPAPTIATRTAAICNAGPWPAEGLDRPDQRRALVRFECADGCFRHLCASRGLVSVPEAERNNLDLREALCVEMLAYTIEYVSGWHVCHKPELDAGAG